jgi:hypothetical protein
VRWGNDDGDVCIATYVPVAKNSGNYITDPCTNVKKYFLAENLYQ